MPDMLTHVRQRQHKGLYQSLAVAVEEVVEELNLYPASRILSFSLKSGVEELTCMPRVGMLLTLSLVFELVSNV
eukprot:339969-Prorocentrum_minimum.AAC.1